MVAGSRVGLHFLTSALRLLEPRADDDFIDRLHYLYTSILLLMFALLVSAKQYVGHPIECFVPAQFTRAMEQYTESYCYVDRTYWIPFQDHIPHRLDDRERKQIGYYQWIPFGLAISALMFHLPASVWRMLSNQSGLNISLVLQTACQEQNIDPHVRDNTVDILSRHIDDVLQYQREFGTKRKHVFLFSLLRIGKVYGSYVTVIYMFVKLLHLSNVILQFYFLNVFLETADYPLFGGHVLYDLLQDREWPDSGKFPRVTLCDFEIRVLGNIHRHTVQCVLVINMFMEKIFIFLWLWMVFLIILSIINLTIWLFTLSVPSCRQAFVEKYLELSIEPSSELAPFVEQFLRPDGVFLLKMVSVHAGNIICSRITESLWNRFIEWQNSQALTYKEDQKKRSSLIRESSAEGHVLRRRSQSRDREHRQSRGAEQNRAPLATISDTTKHYV
uniref:Innexin n=1 Tax=Panagrolaimus sp. ES5 TaxID=591445 RepID=A0AC34GSY8_9BILA